jgi:hypothetical protein
MIFGQKILYNQKNNKVFTCLILLYIRNISNLLLIKKIIIFNYLIWLYFKKAHLVDMISRSNFFQHILKDGLCINKIKFNYYWYIVV